MQFFALEFLDDEFGHLVSSHVNSLTIPRHRELSERHRLYVEHVKEMLEKELRSDDDRYYDTKRIKLADFYDNGLKLYQ